MIKLIRNFALISAVSITTAACTTMADAKIAQGSGEKHTYPASYDTTFDETENVINASDLDLVVSNRDSGEILAQRGVSLASYGENVAIFIVSKSENQTDVEVVSKKAMKTNIFAPDWGQRIHDDLKIRLK